MPPPSFNRSPPESARHRVRQAAAATIRAAVASAVLLFAGEALAQLSPSPFSSPSATSEYLNFIRQRASEVSESTRPGIVTPEAQTPQGYPSIPGIPQIPSGPDIPSPSAYPYTEYPSYPTPETGLGPSAADLGRTRFGLPETATETSATKPFVTYPTYDPLSGPSLFPTGTQPPGQLGGVPQIAQEAYDRAYDPYRQFQEAQSLNPYRNDIFRTGVSEGRFGRQEQYLAQAARTLAFSSGRDDNIQFGDFTMRIGMLGGLDYTDNALFTSVDKTEDIIGRLGMQLAATYPFTEKNTLRFSIGIGYERYLLNPELNDIIRSSGLDLSISPGSRLSWELDIGNIFFTVFDSFSVTQRTQDDFLTEAQDNYAQFNNTFGIGLDWLVNNATNITASINRADNIALASELSGLDSVSYNFLGGVAYSPSETWTLGLQSSITTTERDSASLSDSNTFQIGPYLAVPLTQLTQVRVGGGIQEGSFDPNDTTTLTDQLDFTEPYYNVSIFNRLNKFTTQSLSLGRQTGLGSVTEFYTGDYSRYVLSFNFTRTAISTSIYYESQDNNGGSFEETIKRYGGAINIRHQLNRKITLFMGYNYGLTDSIVPPEVEAAFADVSLRDPNDPTQIRNVPGSDVTQQTFNFDISYPLTKEVDVILGYRRLKAESTSEGGSFTENRGSINFSYNF